MNMHAQQCIGYSAIPKCLDFGAGEVLLLSEVSVERVLFDEGASLSVSLCGFLLDVTPGASFGCTITESDSLVEESSSV